MKFNRTTKSALFTSVVSLFLCFAMLLGTTFAWFTDSATSANNKIVAGTLSVDLLLDKAADGNYASIKDESAPIFGTAGLAQNNLNTLWEPGKTQVAYLAIENTGSLDLAYKVNIAVTSYTKDLYEAMEYMIVPDATAATPVVAGNLDWNNGIAVVPGPNATAATRTELTKDSIHYFALVIHMNEDAGNEYQGGEITFDISVLATQLDSELDSFDNQYDVAATFPTYGVGTVAVDGSKLVYPIDARNEQLAPNDTKVGYANVPAAALADDAESTSISIIRQQNVDGNVVVASDETAATYEVKVTGLKENNDQLVEAAIRVGTGLTGVKLYHNNNGTLEELGFDYIGEYIIFKSASFSPFTVVCKAEIVESEPVEPTNPALPQATVSQVTDTENVTEWTYYMGNSNTPKLDVVYKFKAPHNSETVLDCMYKDWLCDYYVKFVPAEGSAMTDLPEASIALGGEYGTYGWIGFDNPEAPTNTWIPLLGTFLPGDTNEDSPVNTYWTYERIVGLVEEFNCGVAAINDNVVSDGKFIVQLRLTDPTNYDHYEVVKEITYDFPVAIDSAEDLQNAVNEGGSYVLTDDIDLNDLLGGN